MADGKESTIRLSSYQSPLYLPQYVGVATGLFADDGVNVDLVPSPGPWPDVIAAVRQHRADILVGNIWFGLRSEHEPDPFISFAYCAQQCRYVVLRRADPEAESRPFAWSDMVGTTVLFPTDVATPWVAFCQIMHGTGIPLDGIRLVLGFGPEESLDEFERGIGEFAVCAAERVPEGSESLVVASFAATLGPVPWAVYCAPRSMFEARRADLEAFTRGIGASEEWIATHSDREIAELVAPLLGKSADVLENTIGRYRQIKLWPRSAHIPDEHSIRWHDALVRWGLLAKAVNLDDLVVNLAIPDARAGQK